MKYLEDLRDIHRGEEIWVIGAGPSLDAYPINFFRDKICIGMNWVFSVFVDIGDGIDKFESKAFYSIHEHRPPADWIAKHIPHFLKACFFLLPPMRIQTGRSKMVWWEDYKAHNDKIRYMKWGLRGPKRAQAADRDFEDTVKCIMAGRNDCEYVCRGTTLHWAVQAAVVLGARKIYLVGASTKGGHMRKHGSLYQSKTRVKPYDARTKPWVTGTKSLARIFRSYGVEIVRYYYDKGEVVI